MDALAPKLVWIDGRCYRKRGALQLDAITASSDIASGWAEQLADEDAPSTLCAPFSNPDRSVRGTGETTVDEEEDEKDLTELGARIELGDGKKAVKVSVPIAPEFVKHVVGRNGDKAKQLQLETRATLTFPHRGTEGDIRTRAL